MYAQQTVTSLLKKVYVTVGELGVIVHGEFRKQLLLVHVAITFHKFKFNNHTLLTHRHTSHTKHF